MANIFPQRFQKAREVLGLTQVDMGNKLGITAKYLGMIERGDKDVDEGSSLGLLFRVVEDSIGNAKNLPFPTESGTPLKDERGDGPAKRLGIPNKPGHREIPVIGWAHAGQAASYEELPESWQEMIPTNCRDPKAFGVTLEGDSMEPMFRDGDMLVLMPSQRIHNGCLAVVRLASDGVLLRRIEVRGERLRLVPLNPRYEAEELSNDQVSWAYPVWGRWSQVWK